MAALRRRYFSVVLLGQHHGEAVKYGIESANTKGGHVRHSSHSSSSGENRFRSILTASSSFLVVVSFLLIGLWSGQAVFFFMAVSVLVMGFAEILSVRRPGSARTIMWIGRAGMLAAILYVLVFLLPGT